MFQSAASIYQEAIDKSGYNYQLKFDSTASEPKTKTRSRKRHILWFNPPFNSTVSTNIGREFLNLIDECFPPTHPLAKVLNRKNVKVSYSTTSNMEQIISGKNAKVLKTTENEVRKCNCPNNKECPLDKKKMFGKQHYIPSYSLSGKRGRKNIHWFDLYRFYGKIGQSQAIIYQSRFQPNLSN